MTMGGGHADADDRGVDLQTPVGAMQVVHCHDCWKYTDDMRLKEAVLHAALNVIVNGGTLDVKNSDAWEAANKYLVNEFSPPVFRFKP